MAVEQSSTPGRSKYVLEPPDYVCRITFLVADSAMKTKLCIASWNSFICAEKRYSSAVCGVARSLTAWRARSERKHQREADQIVKGKMTKLEGSQLLIQAPFRKFRTCCNLTAHHINHGIKHVRIARGHNRAHLSTHSGRHPWT